MAVYRINCDESCIERSHKKLVIGGLMVSDEWRDGIDGRINAWRERVRMANELKWTKVSTGKLREYKQFASGSIRLTKLRQMAFRSIVFTSAEVNFRKFHKGQDLGLYKFTYHLIVHCFAPLLRPEDRIVVYPDKRQSSVCLAEVRNAMNNGIRIKCKGIGPMVVEVDPTDSKTCNFAQINDVLMGAVGFHNNDRHLNPASGAAKVELSAHIARKAELVDLRANTPRSRTHFGIWQFRFKIKKS